jgi:hypothetical protein
MSKNSKDIKKIQSLLKLDFGWENRQSRNTIDKIVKERLFGKGKWMSEPDEITWKEATPNGAVYCCILRNEDMGNLRGYITIPENHQYFKLANYDDIPLNCHGGLTYMGVNDKGQKIVGFDCAHMFDLIPAMKKILALAHGSPMRKGKNADVYRSVNYVRDDILDLVKQIVRSS